MSQELEFKVADRIEERVDEAVQAEVVQVGEDGEQATKKLKWHAWQDRLLVEQVLAQDPFGSPRGQTLKAWEAISSALALLKPVPIIRSAAACKARCATLTRVHKV